MREYEGAWNRLKKEKTLRITANRLLHSRIIKAIVKEKWMDIAYKLEIEPKYATISTSRDYAVVTIYLEEKIPTTEIGRYL